MRAITLRSCARLALPAALTFVSLGAHAADRPLPAYLDTSLEQPISARALLGGGGDTVEAAKRFSISLSLGLKPDMAALGATIAQDGTVDTADTTLASQAYATNKALMSDRDNLAIWHNSDNTSSKIFKMLGKEPTLGGALLGGEVGGTVQYELDELAKLPIFVRTGFHYAKKFSGGHQERTLGNVAFDYPGLAFTLTNAGLDPADYSGGTMITDYDAAWFEIPLSFGFKVGMGGQSFFYGSLGVSYFSGGFSVGLDVDEKYANVLGTHLIDEGGLVPAVYDLSPDGAVVDRVKFDMSGMGINYGLGGQIELGYGLVWFIELNSSGAAKTVYSSDLDPKTAQLLTSTSSKTLAEEDPEWFKRLAFPVVAGGGTLRTGLRMYLF